MTNQQFDKNALKEYLSEIEFWPQEDHEIGISCAEKLLYHLYRQSPNSTMVKKIQFVSLVRDYHQQHINR